MAKSGAMRLLAEMLPVALIIATLGFASYLLQASRVRHPSRQIQPVTAGVSAAPIAAPAAPAPRPPAFDDRLIDGEVALIDAMKAAEMAMTAEFRARIGALNTALAASRQEVERWRARGMLMRTQAAALESRADATEAQAVAIESQLEESALERDVVKRGMEAARLRAEDSYAVLPLRSASGTWREPIVIDCEGSTVRVLPDGETVLMSEMEGLLARRSHPLVSLVRRRAAAIEEIPLRDGAPRVPYILFLVRPDGIHAYYQARALLESLGIAFGYELVGQDWKVQAPHSLAPRQVVDRVARAEPDEPTRLESRADVTPAGDDLHVWRAPKPASDAALGGGSDPGGRVLQPGDDPSLDPPMPQVADPRRPTGRAIDEGDLKGYTEVIPGRHTADEPTRRPSVREGTGTGVRAGGSDRKQADPGGTPDRPNAPTAERAGADPLAGLPRAPLSASGPEAWYDVSVICRAGEVVIQPGGYRITETMVNQGTLLTDRLRSIAAGAGGAQPRLRFVVEPGGEKLFWAVREQTTYADLDWPTTLKVMEGAALKHALGGRERDR